MAKLFITKKQKETYSKLWEKVNEAPITEADEKAGYPPNCNKGYVEKDGKCVLAPDKKKGYATLSQQEAIDCSSKIIGALRRKQKDHNSEFNTKAQFAKIKEAYRMGVLSRSENSKKTCNQWGIANVNAFLDKSEELNFEKADEDIKKYNLKIHFDNLEDLYLEEYSPINKVY